jgi:Na+/melibiose symporter-like transporter
MAHQAPSGKSPETLATVAVLLTVAVVAALVVPIYARLTPKLGPFPFFYWYQFILVPVTAVLTWVCYLLLKTRHARDAGPEHGRGAHR